MKNFKKIIELLLNWQIAVDYSEKEGKHSFTFYGDHFSHGNGCYQSWCALSTSDESLAIELLSIPQRLWKGQDISMEQREFMGIAEHIKYDLPCEGLKVELGDTFHKY